MFMSYDIFSSWHIMFAQSSDPPCIIYNILVSYGWLIEVSWVKHPSLAWRRKEEIPKAELHYQPSPPSTYNFRYPYLLLKWKHNEVPIAMSTVVVGHLTSKNNFRSLKLETNQPLLRSCMQTLSTILDIFSDNFHGGRPTWVKDTNRIYVSTLPTL